MILQRLATSIRKQDWFTVLIETLIVVLGVFLGLQLGNWNEDRAADQRRAEIIQALATDLEDAVHVQEEKQVFEINKGLAAWEAAFDRGEYPTPYYFRIEGSDTAPDTWVVLQQMDIGGLFDPVTIFDLNYYYSELEGVGQKYIRYVTFVETEILPFENGDPLYFYTDDGTELKPRYAASMDRLREFGGEVQGLANWAKCLRDRLEAGTRPEKSCVRADESIRGSSLITAPFSDEAEE
ncbi:MAG: hypothetical protein RLN72_15155 [Henriciella sp.]